MMDASVALWLPAAGYLLGSIPFGLLLARLFGAGDIRRQGSGNIGATNVLRTAGRTAGAAALLLDGAKGWLPVALAVRGLGADAAVVVATAVAAFLGHLFPVWLGFKGGKGVATGLGVFVAWTPVPALLAMLCWLGTAALFRFSSLASLAAFAALPVFIFLLTPEAARAVALPGAIVIALGVFGRHHSNIRRLLAGTESRIGQKGKGS